jgi:hypothetical protein
MRLTMAGTSVRPPFFSPALRLFVLFAFTALSPSVLLPVRCQFSLVPVGPTATGAPAAVRFPARWATLPFTWAGAMWIAGGADGVTEAPNGFHIDRNDVWGSYDFGRTWQQPTLQDGTVVTLPATCASTANRGLVYNGAVWLICSGFTSYAFQGSYVSSSPTLTEWTHLPDAGYGCGDPGPNGHYCTGFNVEWMAVPFDGVGTLIMVNNKADQTYNAPADPTSNYVRWRTDTGAFQDASLDPDKATYWNVFTASGSAAPYSTPWSPRFAAGSTTDAEGLVLIMAGGQDSTGSGLYGELNDVWQLSWTSDLDDPLVYQVSTAFPAPRYNFAMYHVHDWLFIYGGTGGTGTALDDAYMSFDYGATWTSFEQSPTTNGMGREYVNALTFGRRLFIIAGRIDTSAQVAPTSEIYVATW